MMTADHLDQTVPLLELETREMRWWRRRISLLAFGSKCLLVLMAVGYLGFLHSRIDSRRNDFSAVYLWAAAARADLNPYVEDLRWLEAKIGLDTNGNTRANYPPSFIVAFQPIAYLSPTVAYWTWFCLSVLMLVAALLLLLEKQFFWFALLMVFYEPLTDHFLWAQSYTLLLLLLVILKRAIQNAWWMSAGLILGFLGVLKIFPFLLVGYLVRTRRYRPALYAVAAVAVLTALTMVLFGVGRSLSFFNSTSFRTWEPWLFAHSNVSVGAMVMQWFRFLAGYEHGLPGAWGRLIAAASGVALLILTILGTPSSDPEGKAFGLWIVTGTVLFPICWPSHLVLFIILFAELFACRGYAPPFALALGAACYALSVAILPMHWALLQVHFKRGWLYTAERSCLIALVVTAYSCAYLLSRHAMNERLAGSAGLAPRLVV